MEASGNLVVPAVFKTDVADSLGQAGSIPVRLLHPLARCALNGESGDLYPLLNIQITSLVTADGPEARRSAM